jgi:hypothetical protein
VNVRGGALDDAQALALRVAAAFGCPCVVALGRAPSPGDDPPLRYLAWTGLPPTVQEMGRVPVSWSPDALVLASGAALVVEDARRDARTAGLALVAHGDLGAYAGVPVRVPDEGVVGTLSVFCPDARPFGAAERLALELAGEAVGASLAGGGPARVAEPAVGVTVADRWRVTANLGSGGQGSVWLGVEEGSGRQVALKVGGQAIDEARQLATVSHPNLVAVHAAGALPGERSFLVMDHVDGPPLDEVVVAGQSTAGASWIELLTQVAGALTALHARELVHGDVKAANVLVDASRQEAVLVDLGLGLRLGLEVGPDGCGGTVGSSAPEQFGALGAARLTPAADAYGLATLAWGVLSREPAFERPTRVARLYAQMTGQLEPMPAVLERFRAVFEQALHPDPSRRHPSPLAFVTALHHELRGGEERGPWSAAAVVRGARRAAGRLSSGDVARATASLSARHQAQWAAAEATEAPVPTEVLVAWLRAWSGRSGGRLHDLGAAAGAAGGREVLRQAHVLNDAASLLAAMSGLLPRMHSWAHLAGALTSVHASTGTLVVPSRWQDTMVPFLSGWLAGWFAGAGADLEVEWGEGPSRETAGLRLAWHPRG